MKTLYMLYPGLPTPAQFKPTVAPELLAMQDLWVAARTCGPALIFRVRTEADPGANLTTADKLESCIGIIDSATRWRVVFNMVRTALNAAGRNPELAKMLNDAMQIFGTQHPASIAPALRRKMYDDIAAFIEANEDKLTGFEVRVAGGIAVLAQADNDVEAAFGVPFQMAFNPFSETAQAADYAGRVATLETLSGAVLLTEASNRLAERLPAWMSAAMPTLSVAGAARTEEGNEPDDE
jgi:hypothetical protein